MSYDYFDYYEIESYKNGDKYKEYHYLVSFILIFIVYIVFFLLTANNYPELFESDYHIFQLFTVIGILTYLLGKLIDFIDDQLLISFKYEGTDIYSAAVEVKHCIDRYYDVKSLLRNLKSYKYKCEEYHKLFSSNNEVSEISVEFPNYLSAVDKILKVSTLIDQNESLLKNLAYNIKIIRIKSSDSSMLSKTKIPALHDVREKRTSLNKSTTQLINECKEIIKS